MGDFGFDKLHLEPIVTRSAQKVLIAGQFELFVQLYMVFSYKSVQCGIHICCGPLYIAFLKIPTSLSMSAQRLAQLHPRHLANLAYG